MRFKYPLMLVSLAVLPSAANATIHFDHRQNVYSIGYPDLDFASADFTGTIGLDTHADTVGETGPLTIGVPAGLSGISWTGDGTNVDITDVNAGPGVLTATYNALTDQPATETAIFGGTVSGGLGNFIGTGQFAGRHVLEFHGVSPGAVDDHGGYDYLLVMKGDWSQAGTGVGQHELLGINSAWTITADFFYDAPNDQTLFAATNADYLNDGQHDVDLGIRLNGSPVPEPASMTALGLGALALLRRRRR